MRQRSKTDHESSLGLAFFRSDYTYQVRGAAILCASDCDMARPHDKSEYEVRPILIRQMGTITIILLHDFRTNYWQPLCCGSLHVGLPPFRRAGLLGATSESAGVCHVTLHVPDAMLRRTSHRTSRVTVHDAGPVGRDRTTAFSGFLSARSRLSLSSRTCNSSPRCSTIMRRICI
jgi:hypothetical protein